MRAIKYLLSAALLLGFLGWYFYPGESQQKSAQLGLLYCEYGNNSLLLDYYPGKPGQGLVVYAHGGGWQQGSRQLKPPMAELVNRLREKGLGFVSLDYRLAPEHKLPAMLDDLDCALEYLRRRSHELGFDANHIGLLGSSAGGHLALLATARHKALNQHPIQAVAALYAPTNLANNDQIWLELPDDQYKQFMLDVVGSAENGKLKLASPLFYARYLDVPSLLVYGDRDPVVGPGQGMDLYTRLRILGHPSEFLLVRDSAHLVPLSEKTRPDWYELSEKITSFFADALSH